MESNEYVEWYHKKFKLDSTTKKWPTYKKDHLALISLIEKYDINSVLEIGTWSGWSMMLMWLHPNIKRAKAVDIHKDMSINYESESKECQLQDKSFYGHYFKNTDVKMEFCDSMVLQPKEKEKYDMVFIDGNHEIKYVSNDTKLALKYKPKLIVWHDSNYDKVKTVLNNYTSKGHKVNVFKESIVAYMEVKNV